MSCYTFSSPATLKPLDAVYLSALCFITGDGFLTHRCILYEKVGWLCLTIQREQPCLLFTKPFVVSSPRFYALVIKWSDTIRLIIPRMISETGKPAFTFYAPDKQNELQDSLKLDRLVSIETFRMLIHDASHMVCSCFSCTSCLSFYPFNISLLYNFIMLYVPYWLATAPC